MLICIPDNVGHVSNKMMDDVLGDLQPDLDQGSLSSWTI